MIRVGRSIVAVVTFALLGPTVSAAPAAPQAPPRADAAERRALAEAHVSTRENPTTTIRPLGLMIKPWLTAETIDCGHVFLAGNGRVYAPIENPIDRCAVEALRGERPFQVWHSAQGTDSTITQGIIRGADGSARMVTHDSLGGRIQIDACQRLTFLEGRYGDGVRCIVAEGGATRVGF